MRIPFTKIFVAPHWFEIKEDSKLNAVAKVTGAAMTDSQMILMDPDVGETVAMETLFHEVLHCVWHQVLHPTRYTEDQEEEIIWGISPRILALLRDNPQLVTWITSVASTTKSAGSTKSTSKSQTRKPKGRG